MIAGWEIQESAFVGYAATPAAENIFKVCYERKTKYLPEDQAQTFHNTVAQLLFMSAREHWGIYTLVELLTKRVKKSYEDDWGKLKHVLE